jgi:hypothetical protein
MTKPDTSRLKQAIESAQTGVTVARTALAAAVTRLQTLQEALDLTEGTPIPVAPKVKRKRRTRQEIAAAKSVAPFGAGAVMMSNVIAEADPLPRFLADDPLEPPPSLDRRNGKVDAA